MATTGRDQGRDNEASSPKIFGTDEELFPTTPKCVVRTDFTLDHYNLSGSVANFDIDGVIPTDGATGADTPKQAPFSKRFQILRAPGADSTSLDSVS